MMKVEEGEEAVVAAKVQRCLAVVLERGHSIRKIHSHCNILVLGMRCIRLIAREHSDQLVVHLYQQVTHSC